MKREISAIDLFCGVGGLTCGLKMAGIDVPVGYDIADECRYAYEKNNKGSRFISKDVSKVTAQELQQIWSKKQYRLLAGCAPCQPFSTYRQSNGLQQDRRYFLLDEFARLVDESRPELVTMENVPNLEKREIFQEFVHKLRDIGYYTQHLIFECDQFGIPQSRKRLVLLASLLHDDLSICVDSKQRTVRQRIAKLPPIAAGQTDSRDSLHRAPSLSEMNLRRIQASRPGGSWKDWPIDILCDCHKRSTGKGYTPVYGRMEWDKPSPTLTTQCYNYGSGRFGHPEQDRAISLREAAMLQDFPRNYEFEPPNSTYPTTQIARMIGNAVPVGLGRIIGNSFNRHLALWK
ncbi:MAG: DNA cytosine methyltransferase [Verrucomicrobiota bacterium]